MTPHHVFVLEKLPEDQKARDDEHPKQDLFNGRVHLGGNLSLYTVSWPATIPESPEKPGQNFHHHLDAAKPLAESKANLKLCERISRQIV
jgi:hypothetical protein